MLVIESLKSSFTITYITVVATVRTFTFFKEYVTCTMKGFTDTTFLVRLHCCLMLHIPCLFVNLQLQEILSAKSVMTCVMAHFWRQRDLVFYLVQSMHYNSVSTIVTNKCTQLSFNSQYYFKNIELLHVHHVGV